MWPAIAFTASTHHRLLTVLALITLLALQELISGIVWLVRDGENFVQESLEEEYMGYQETGTSFATVKSARTALGHDQEGRLVLLQMEGETWAEGIDLYEFADLLVELGIINAINLDGGGSATMTQNHSLVRYVPLIHYLKHLPCQVHAYLCISIVYTYIYRHIYLCAYIYLLHTYVHRHRYPEDICVYTSICSYIPYIHPKQRSDVVMRFRESQVIISV